MIAPYFFEVLALGVAIAGLLAVVAEILMKDPRILAEIGTDVVKMAQPARRTHASVQPSNSNLRKAA